MLQGSVQLGGRHKQRNHDWANEKRIALQAWGDRVQAIVEGRGMDGANNVVALRA